MEPTAAPDRQASLVDVARARARAEWREWSAVLAAYEAEENAARAGGSEGMRLQVELSFIPHDLARQLHWSDAQLSHRVAQARRVRDNTARVWHAFSDGRLNEAKVREIAGALLRLQRPESIERLDGQVVGYAERHTLVETRRWLRVFVARVEADLACERSERARDDRGVDVLHGDDGMSTMIIQHASHVIAAVDRRLAKEAAAMGAQDERTLQQRRADLFAAWMTTNESGQAALGADIAVTITASALAGATREPAIAADGGWAVPADWILDAAKQNAGGVFWHRMILDPVSDDVLAHEYRGRFAPEVLAKALEFRDGVCQAPGCCRPASQCDIDHRIPHEAGGPTAGWNLGPYCRRHHIQKGFGLLDTGPTAKSPPGRSRNTPLHSVGTPDFATSFMERRLERILISSTLGRAA